MGSIFVGSTVKVVDEQSPYFGYHTEVIDLTYGDTTVYAACIVQGRARAFFAGDLELVK